ncbi:hypothetical protein PT274_00300 [Leuconostocaceae bacterium ESL0958]|nr:hypothetical protein [Leuconostocaceae bacterium ESL0958]
MRADQSIQFKVDGEVVSQAAIREMEDSRYDVVFDDFESKQIPLTMNGQGVDCAAAKEMDLDQKKEVLAQTREKLGRSKILELWADDIKESDAMWQDIAAKADDSQPLQQAIVEVTTDNISLVQFLLFNQSLAKENNLALPSKIHPEHYYFDAGKGGTQTIIETFGMYKKPSYLHLVPADDGMKKPITPDNDTTMAMIGKTLLADSMQDTKIIGMHQLKDKGDSMVVKLGVFLPASAPSAILEGHKWHLMVEFNNGLHIAADKKPSWLQKIILKQVLKKMAKKAQA